MAVETVVAYDATDRLSSRHLMMRRNREHRSVCGESLQPWGSFRTVEGFDTDRDSPEADCRPCLFEHAKVLVDGMFEPDSWRETRAAINASEDVDEKIVRLLRLILKGSAWQPSQLVREHFPRDLVERAAV